MNSRHTLIYSIVFVALSVGTLSATQPIVFNQLNIPYTQDFNDYRGTVATLPDGFFVEWDESRVANPFTGVGDFSDPGSSYGGLTAYTAEDNDTDYSFGIRERVPIDLRDARLYMFFTNTTGQAISGFVVEYDVEAWFIGDRRNRIRLKYDDQLGAGRFEEDIFSTDNPSTEWTPDTRVNGSLADNRTTVTGFVNFATYEDPFGDPFGPLADGAAAYFRWQFSNADGDGGTLRSGLAINTLIVTPIPEPSLFGIICAVGLLYIRRTRT